MKRQLYVPSRRRVALPKGWRPVRESERERYAPLPERSRRIRIIRPIPTKEERA